MTAAPVASPGDAVRAQRRILVYATRRALAQAERLLPAGAVLEIEVERAVRVGRKRKFLPRGFRRLRRGERSVFLLDGTIAVIEKGTGRFTPQRAWFVTDLIPRRLPAVHDNDDERRRR